MVSQRKWEGSWRKLGSRCMPARWVRRWLVKGMSGTVVWVGFTTFFLLVNRLVHSDDLSSQLYTGATTRPEIKPRIEEGAKLVISIGALKSDLNTGNFTHKLDIARTVEVRFPNPKTWEKSFLFVSFMVLFINYPSCIIPLQRSNFRNTVESEWNTSYPNSLLLSLLLLLSPSSRKLSPPQSPNGYTPFLKNPMSPSLSPKPGSGHVSHNSSDPKTWSSQRPGLPRSVY